jgi:hypothetical protein
MDSLRGRTTKQSERHGPGCPYQWTSSLYAVPVRRHLHPVKWRMLSLTGRDINGEAEKSYDKERHL